MKMKKTKFKKVSKKSLSIFLSVVMILTTCSVAFGMQVFASTWSEGSQLDELAAALKSDVVLALSDTSDTSVVYTEGSNVETVQYITNTVTIADYDDYLEFLTIVDLIMEEAEFCLFSDYSSGTTTEMTRGYNGFVQASGSSDRKTYGENMYSVSNELQGRLLDVMGDDYYSYGIELFTDVIFENWINHDGVSNKIHNSSGTYIASEPDCYKTDTSNPFLTFTLEVITTDVAGWIAANGIENYDDIELQTNYVILMELSYAVYTNLVGTTYGAYAYTFTAGTSGNHPDGTSLEGTGEIPNADSYDATDDGEELISEIDTLISAIESFNDTYPSVNSLYVALADNAATTSSVTTAIGDLDEYLTETGIDESAIEVAELLAADEYEDYTDKFAIIEEHASNGCEAYAYVSVEGTTETCLSAGTTDTYSCLVCGTITTASTAIDKLDHVYDYDAEPSDESVAASCVADGYDRYYCTYGCGTYYDVTVTASGHDLGDWVVTTPATCEDTGEETRYCEDCTYTETRDVEATGHDLSDWEVTTPATCEDTGEETRYCEDCTYTETRDVEATGHDFGDWEVTTPATCVETGVETRYCEDCTYTETRDSDALGHDYTELVSGSAGDCQTPSTATYKCSRCEETKTYDNEVNTDVHVDELTVVSVEPTCGTDGYTYSYYPCCTTDDEIAALEAEAKANPADGYEATGSHVYGDWTTVTEATCCVDGLEKHVCTKCGYEETQVISATGDHVDADGDGICDNDPDNEQLTDAHEHTWTSYVYTDPTYTQDGYWTYYCVCGEASDETIKDEGSSAALVEADLDDAKDAIDDLSFGPYDEDATADEILESIKDQIADVVGDVDFEIKDFSYVAPTEDSEGSVTFGLDISAGSTTIELSTIVAKINMIGTSTTTGGSHVVVQCDIVWCKCICASDSPIMQFFAKIAIFFWKLFGINQYCGTWLCGGVHY